VINYVYGARGYGILLKIIINKLEKIQNYFSPNKKKTFNKHVKA